MLDGYFPAGLSSESTLCYTYSIKTQYKYFFFHLLPPMVVRSSSNIGVSLHSITHLFGC